MNKESHQFFTKKEYEKVRAGLAKVFTTGKAQQENYTTHKSGKQIPYFYEAYPIEDKGRQYFIGVGLDILDRYALEQKQKRQEWEKRKAKKILDENKRELVATALQISKTGKIIERTLKNINQLLEKTFRNRHLQCSCYSKKRYGVTKYGARQLGNFKHISLILTVRFLSDL